MFVIDSNPDTHTPPTVFGQFVGGGPRVVVSTAAFHARVRGSVPGLGGLKETKLFLPHPRVKVSIVGNLRDREVACSASVSSQSSHHPQEVLLAQFSLYVHKGGLKPDLFHFIWSVRWRSLDVRENALFICSLPHADHLLSVDWLVYDAQLVFFSIFNTCDERLVCVMVK